MIRKDLWKIIEGNAYDLEAEEAIKTAVDAYSKALLQQAGVSGWQDFPEQKPTEGQLVVMSFDGVGIFTHYYKDGLEENFRPFQKMRFIVLPACH